MLKVNSSCLPAARSARTIQVTIRLTPEQFDALTERAKTENIPVRTLMRRRLAEESESRAILREIRRTNELTKRLWLATAGTPDAKAEILRIVNGVEST